ncbi:MAG: sulfopyruvate decarboxylase subunit beta [Dehalococcoidia bacterium]|nr:sulfopyruvate decarboxylase subunit beta [Gammaproteobacteria bacterium]MBH60511.1 sulfopyruvate decarboxylase subunit beta [Dehalococcoidia bacterium]
MIMKKTTSDHLVLSTTGMISREVFSHDDRQENFYMIGSMGLASSFGLGIAKSNPDKKIIILDGDGSFLMNLGAAACIGFYNTSNIVHIILDNFSYESTGSQNSISNKIDLCNIAKSSGYKFVDEIINFDINKISFDKKELSFYRIHVGIESNEEISRVAHTPEEITSNFKLIL